MLDIANPNSFDTWGADIAKNCQSMTSTTSAAHAKAQALNCTRFNDLLSTDASKLTSAMIVYPSFKRDLPPAHSEVPAFALALSGLFQPLLPPPSAGKAIQEIIR
jgi:hypothetical protein